MELLSELLDTILVMGDWTGKEPMNAQVTSTNTEYFDILSEDGSGERVQSIFRRCGEVEVLVYSLS